MAASRSRFTPFMVRYFSTSQPIRHRELRYSDLSILYFVEIRVKL